MSVSSWALGLFLIGKDPPTWYVPEFNIEKGKRSKFPVLRKSINNSKKVLPETVNFFDDPFDAINGVQATIIMTEWSEFQNLDWKKVYKSMKNPKIIYLKTRGK